MQNIRYIAREKVRCYAITRDSKYLRLEYRLTPAKGVNVVVRTTDRKSKPDPSSVESDSINRINCSLYAGLIFENGRHSLSRKRNECDQALCVTSDT